jgi:DNA-directed RNA polymerase subunit RPC12/RpoP
MPVRCADCNATFQLTPDGLVQGAACEHCGGTRLERDQPSPTHSDGDLRDMVDPGTGLDQGGNPLQEGIWATTDGGWQPYPRRDESFASVMSSLQDGFYEFEDDDGEIRLAVKLAGGSWSQKPGEDLSTFFERFNKDQQGDPGQAQWAQQWRNKVVDLRARKQFSDHNLQWQPGGRGRGLMINNTHGRSIRRPRTPRAA